MLDENAPILLVVVDIMMQFCNQRTVVPLSLPTRLGVYSVEVTNLASSEVHSAAKNFDVRWFPFWEKIMLGAP